MGLIERVTLALHDMGLIERVTPALHDHEALVRSVLTSRRPVPSR